MPLYSLADSLIRVHGIGDATFKSLQKQLITTVRDLLLFTPYRYEDRSTRAQVKDVWASGTLFDPKKLYTLKLQVVSVQTIYRKGRNMQKAILQDETGKIDATWFNQSYIATRLQKGEQYLFSGPIKAMGKKLFLTQPLIENDTLDTIHTDRLVPIYSNLPGVKPATLRRIQKHIIDHVEFPADVLMGLNKELFPLNDTLTQIHFPTNKEMIIKARERLAIEELTQLILHSHQIKQNWKLHRPTVVLNLRRETKIDQILKLNRTQLPFELTTSQQQVIQDLLADMTKPHPMNRLLIGDVGSGKTIVAGIALAEVIRHGKIGCLIAPTQMLADQHFQTLTKFFPELQIQLITGATKTTQTKSKNKRSETQFQSSTPNSQLLVGTHAVLNFVQKNNLESAVGLVVFDEQHRFGVNQRSGLFQAEQIPHMLTMTATPIPRSLMLSIFSHLQLSTLNVVPVGRKQTKTWYAPDQKKPSMYDWIIEQCRESEVKNQKFLTLYVCPFIDPSESESMENVAAATITFTELQKIFNPHGLCVELLHGKMTKKAKTDVIKKLYSGEIHVLVTTPIVEVGVDLPQASIMVIDSAERFGLASLHQLRGRVGRSGQQGYCILFSKSKNPDTIKRLKLMETIHKGSELAELDLKNRGAGDIFGVEQHGFDQLKFAEWTNLSSIAVAKNIADQLEKHSMSYDSVVNLSLTDQVIPNAN